MNPWDKVSGEIKGFFLLNEGNMGSNKASLDYYDYETGVYTRNILRNSPFQTAVISLSKMVMPMSVLTPVLSR